MAGTVLMPELSEERTGRDTCLLSRKARGRGVGWDGPGAGQAGRLLCGPTGPPEPTFEMIRGLPPLRCWARAPGGRPLQAGRVPACFLSAWGFWATRRHPPEGRKESGWHLFCPLPPCLAVVGLWLLLCDSCSWPGPHSSHCGCGAGAQWRPSLLGPECFSFSVCLFTKS